jgi:hypothetical protein
VLTTGKRSSLQKSSSTAAAAQPLSTSTHTAAADGKTDRAIIGQVVVANDTVYLL